MKKYLITRVVDWCAVVRLSPGPAQIVERDEANAVVAFWVTETRKRALGANPHFATTRDGRRYIIEVIATPYFRPSPSGEAVDYGIAPGVLRMEMPYGIYGEQKIFRNVNASNRIVDEIWRDAWADGAIVEVPEDSAFDASQYYALTKSSTIRNAGSTTISEEVANLLFTQG